MSSFSVFRRSWVLSTVLLGFVTIHAHADLLSWKNGKAKEQILKFVKEATDETSKNYIPYADRIAVLDNDGTLWSEKPMPVELSFSLDQIREMAPRHPEWKNQQPYKAVLENDQAYFEKLSEHEKLQELMKLVSVSHANIPVSTFEKSVRAWFMNKRGMAMQAGVQYRAYAPMVELVSYLKTKGFKTYIVTGGDADFVRAISMEAYGIPREQVIGTQFETRLDNKDGKFAFVRESKIVQPINNGPGKAINIQRVLGKAPVFAVGNSDGDVEMLDYASSSEHPSLEILVHHDDAKRESAYDNGAEKALAEARRKNWMIVSMKGDFDPIYDEKLQKALGGEARDEE